jgi:hypothetical protein
MTMTPTTLTTEAISAVEAREPPPPPLASVELPLQAQSDNIVTPHLVIRCCIARWPGVQLMYRCNMVGGGHV